MIATKQTGRLQRGRFISVDKPPVALWVQTISTKLRGFPRSRC